MDEALHQLQQEEQQQQLLTKESFANWVTHNYEVYKSIILDRYLMHKDIQYAYLKEHGLPLDSKIEGL